MGILSGKKEIPFDALREAVTESFPLPEGQCCRRLRYGKQKRMPSATMVAEGRKMPVGAVFHLIAGRRACR